LSSSPFGARQLRREDARLVTGHGRYVGDVELPRMLHVAFVRSVHAHAHLRAVMTRRASSRRGCRAPNGEEDKGRALRASRSRR